MNGCGRRWLQVCGTVLGRAAALSVVRDGWSRWGPRRVTRLASLLVWLAWPMLSALLAAPAAAQTPQAQRMMLDLSPDERAWVATHPVVRVGLSQDFPPYYMHDPRTGLPHGFVLEMMALWSQRSGLQFEFKRLGDFGQVLNALERGEVDLTPFTAPISQGRSFASYTRPAYTTNLVLVARRDVPDISPTGDFAGRRLALEARSSVESLVHARFPGARTQAYADAEAALRAVAGGQADLFIGYQQVAVFHIERLFLANLEMRRNLGPGEMALGPAVRADQPLLRSIIDKAVASVTVSDRSRLAERWLPAASVGLPLPRLEAELSAAEQRWVQGHGRLRVGYDANFAPVTQRGTLGEFTGYGADVFRLAAQKAGLTVEMETGASFAEVYEQGRRGELEVIVGMARTPQRRVDYDFVGPFMSMPTVLLTRRDEPSQVAETRDIGARKLALLRGHFLLPELRARHPGMAVVEVERQDQVLAAVAEGAADVGLGNLSVVSELIERRFAGKVIISGMVRDGDSELYFAVPRRLPELTRVLNQGLAAVNESETAALRARWLARDVPGDLSWRQVLQVGGPLLLALLLYLGLLWQGNRRLRAARERERQAREQAEESTHARGRFLAYLAHELRGTLGAVSTGAELLRASDDPVQRSRLLTAISQSSQGLLNMLESTLRHEQSLQAPLVPEVLPVDLSAWWHEVLGPARLAAEGKGLAFEADWRGPLPWVLMDGVRVQQVLQNLLNNAVKFTATGSVRVHARLSAAPTATGRHAPGGLELSVTVRDSGPGLSEADRAALFQPYAQGESGRRSRLGAGLGLAICAQIVRVLKGQLTEVPQPAGQGACFELLLPLALAPLQPEVATGQTAAA